MENGEILTDPKDALDIAPVITADGKRHSLTVLQDVIITELGDGKTPDETAQKLQMTPGEVRKVLRDPVTVQAIFEQAARRLRSEGIPLAINELIRIIGSTGNKAATDTQKLTAVRTLLTYSAAMENIQSKQAQTGAKNVADMSRDELSAHIKSLRTAIAGIEESAIDVTPTSDTPSSDHETRPQDPEQAPPETSSDKHPSSQS